MADTMTKRPSIAPEIRVFISELRAGKSCETAMLSYCWAKYVLPIKEEDWHAGIYRSVAWGGMMTSAAAGDKFDEGGSDDEIADAFAWGLAYDRDRGIVWRAMEKDERPTSGDLIRAMSLDDRVTAARLLGLRRVANAVAGAD